MITRILHTKPAAVIVDMDGTLADQTWRNHRLPDFNIYFVGCENDPVHSHIAVTVNLLAQVYKILIVTGREERWRKNTRQWLERYIGTYEGLWMRADGDYRHDYIIKEEILDQHLLPKYEVIFAIDDRDQVVKMWRRRGIPCLQVAEGDF